jgi:hypothetical protein
MITKFEKMLIVFVLCLTVFVAYTSVQASPEPKKIEKKEDKSKCFCNGLSLPPERQCPTMDDL